MLQAGRLPVRVLDEVDFFFNLSNPTSHTMALVSTQPLTEMSTRNLTGGKKQPVHRADNLAAIYEPNVWKCGSLDLLQP
jgi:ABC-type hemin transport system ATPase subunit